MTLVDEHVDWKLKNLQKRMYYMEREIALVMEYCSMKAKQSGIELVKPEMKQGRKGFGQLEFFGT